MLTSHWYTVRSGFAMVLFSSLRVKTAQSLESLGGDKVHVGTFETEQRREVQSLQINNRSQPWNYSTVNKKKSPRSELGGAPTRGKSVEFVPSFFFKKAPRTLSSVKILTQQQIVESNQ